MGKKFILSDLDGTLLDKPNEISDKYIEKLNKLINMGLNFTIATGRDLRKTKKAIKTLIMKYPVILTNGALLVDINTERFLEVTHIAPNLVDQILSFSKELNISLAFMNHSFKFLKIKYLKYSIYYNLFLFYPYYLNIKN